MVIQRFPDISQADEQGLLAFGGDLEVESLILAYTNGIFPWPYDEETLAWFAPRKRTVLFLDELHIQRRLARILKGSRFTLAIDTDFRGVISLCAEVVNRGDQQGTWITANMIDAYCDLFEAGFCHSFETYCDNKLVGGMYGVQIGGYFGAESSFYRMPNASKAAMCGLIDYLREQSISWFDCQVLTPLSQGFGAREIPRAQFMDMLKQAVSTESHPNPD
jgi:leucyl/phenylalanyl-tRNA--protein transferase